MKHRHLLALLLPLSLCFLPGCGSDEDTDLPSRPTTLYQSGAFISNQGPFNTGTGTITYIGRDTVIAEAYSSANGGEVLGNIVQSFNVIDTIALIAVNNGGKVVAASANSLEKMYEVQVPLPRYSIEIDNRTAAISYWGDDGFSGGVKLIDIHTGVEQEDIDLGGAPERMLVYNNKLYVAMSRGFQQDNRLISLSLDDYSVVDVRTVADHPHTFLIDRESRPWLVCGGYTDFDDPENSRNGALILLDGEDGRVLPNGVEQAAISADGNTVYLLTSAGLESMALVDTYEENVLIEGFFQAIAIEAVSGNIYLADAGDFVSPGTVTIYDAFLQVIDTITTGVVPGDIYLR